MRILFVQLFNVIHGLACSYTVLQMWQSLEVFHFLSKETLLYMWEGKNQEYFYFLTNFSSILAIKNVQRMRLCQAHATVKVRECFSYFSECFNRCKVLRICELKFVSFLKILACLRCITKMLSWCITSYFCIM